jgi:hypothetical protein
MDWIYNNERVTEVSRFDGFIGYVYLIRNLQNNRAYIGKKLFKFKKTKQVKGKKKKILVESDWKDYYSSSEELKADVAKLGKKNFHREIIHLCKNKGTLNYLELREQIDRRVLESDDWYNGFVGSKIHKSHVRL